jgi:thioredoxin 1
MRFASTYPSGQLTGRSPPAVTSGSVRHGYTIRDLKAPKGNVVNRSLFLALLAAVALNAHATQWPYDEKADAPAQVQHALDAARLDHKKVLLVFGANWCGDCRALDKAMHGSSQALIGDKFHVIKIDVGNFNKNLELAARYGNPIKMGIPAVVLLDVDGGIIYSTKGGELADARRMGDRGIYDFLAQRVAAAKGG